MKLGVKVLTAGISFAKDMKQIDEHLQRSTKRAAVRTERGLKGDLRAQTKAAGLGQKVANAWRGAVYPEKEDSTDAAVVIRSNAPHIIEAYDKGALIRSQDGFWLAMPTENAPKRGMGGKRISPSNFPEHRLGKLRFIYRGPGKAGLLVTDNMRASYTRKTGALRGFRAASASAKKSGKGLTTVVMFTLVPQVSIKKKLDVAGAARKWGGEYAKFIDQEMSKGKKS